MLQASKFNAIDSEVYDDCDSHEENGENSTRERRDQNLQSTPVSLNELSPNN